LVDYVFALQALETRNNITNGVITHMTHMQSATWVWEHRKTVILFFALIFGDFKYLVFFPVTLDF
jgi:hypothetical protein